MENNKSQYYVYRVTDTRDNTFYYGSHKAIKENLLYDLKSYGTSSYKKKNIIKYPNLFKFKIIKIFSNPTDALNYEIKLQQKLAVDKNPKFWNKVIQNPKFIGVSKQSEEHRQKRLENAKKTKDENKKTLKYKFAAICGISKRKNTLVNGKTIEEISSEKRLKTLRKNNYNFKQDVYSNPKQISIIKIYDNKDNLIFECKEGFKTFCKKNNLPYNAFRKSYVNNEKVYSKDNPGLKAVKELGLYDRYKNWYASKAILGE